jgi:hypothetical protein
MEIDVLGVEFCKSFNRFYWKNKSQEIVTFLQYQNYKPQSGNYDL